MVILWGLGGMLVLLAIATLFSTDRRRINLRTVGAALAVQVAFGALVLYVPVGKSLLQGAGDAVQGIINSATAGIDFLFGGLVPEGSYVFAIQVLPVIVFVASLSAVLFHLGILQWVVRIIGGAFAKLFGTTVPESMNTAANIFLGHTEAPLMIRPYLKKLTHSELFAVMTGGMATVAGTVMVGYSLMGVPLEYLLAAAFMAAPGALVMAKIMVPAGATLPEPAAKSGTDRFAWLPGRKKQKEATAGAEDTAPTAEDHPEDLEEEPRAANVIEAAARGANDGLKMALGIGAMLLAFISLIALINIIIGGVGGWFGHGDLTLQQIFGVILSPIMFAVGVPWDEAVAAGSFVGQKIVLNEFVAFSEFGPVIDTFTPKTQAIITFALTGFANFAGIAMQIGALGGLAPNQRSRIAQLGMRSVLAGTLANLMSATIAGIMVAL